MEINSCTFLQLQHALSSSKCTREITEIGIIQESIRLHKEPPVTEKDACLQQKIHFFHIIKTIQLQSVNWETVQQLKNVFKYKKRQQDKEKQNNYLESD